MRSGEAALSVPDSQQNLNVTKSPSKKFAPSAPTQNFPIWPPSAANVTRPTGRMKWGLDRLVHSGRQETALRATMRRKRKVDNIPSPFAAQAWQAMKVDNIPSPSLAPRAWQAMKVDNIPSPFAPRA